MPEVKLYTPKVAVFLNTATFETPTWKRIGKGVTGLTLNYNPQVSTEQYIHEDSATSSTDSYQVAQDLPMTCYAGEPVFDYLDAIRMARGVGSAAACDLLIVYLYTTSPYKAERNAGNIAINDFGGDAGAPVVLNATISFNGDPVRGTATVVDGVPVFVET